MNSKITKLMQLIRDSNNIVFFGGAGVSTASGIQDFRGANGLYNEQYKIPPEIILSYTFFIENPDEFYAFFKDKFNLTNALPNSIHKALTLLEKAGKLKYIITQNVDGLHQKSGSENVIELHGSIYKNYCVKCNRFYEADYIFQSSGIPKCKCGGIVKPGITLYEENLNRTSSSQAIKAIEECDLLIVGGTSLVVQPVSSYVTYFKGENLVIINNSFTKYDNLASLVINDNLEPIFSQLLKEYTSSKKWGTN